jgi:hypothetical protein
MRIKERAIHELQTLQPDKLMVVYEMILLLKRDSPIKRSKKTIPAYKKVRSALKNCHGSFSADILADRGDRI